MKGGRQEEWNWKSVRRDLAFVSQHLAFGGSEGDCVGRVAQAGVRDARRARCQHIRHLFACFRA